MAYGSGDYALTIRGDLAGGEVWANRWAIKGTGDPQDAAGAFHDFYDVWSNACDNKWKATGCTVKDLFTGLSSDLAWTTQTGQVTADPALPTECAIRASISTGNHNGGPFLAGAAASVLDDDGRFDSGQMNSIANGMDALVNTDLVAADFSLGLDSPTDSLVYVAVAVRLGEVFDVIRRRRNRLSEAYHLITIP